jgi:tetratricopeptide (TPR) repeat protein
MSETTQSTESAKPMPSGGFLGHNGQLWQFIASWFVPVIMTIAYIVLALTSETDATGWAWMSIGLAFVLVMWWLFRTLTKSAALTRAIAIGDVGRITQIDGRPIYRAIAHEMHGQWSEALATLATVTPVKPRDRVQLTTVRIGALVETGEVAKARELLATLEPELARLDPRLQSESHIAARLATGKVLAAERKNREALEVLQKVIDDIRAGQQVRALAHHYAARAAAADGQHAVADKHRERAAVLAPTSWFAS